MSTVHQPRARDVREKRLIACCLHHAPGNASYLPLQTRQAPVKNLSSSPLSHQYLWSEALQTVHFPLPQTLHIKVGMRMYTTTIPSYLRNLPLRSSLQIPPPTVKDKLHSKTPPLPLPAIAHHLVHPRTFHQARCCFPYHKSGKSSTSTTGASNKSNTSKHRSTISKKASTTQQKSPTKPKPSSQTATQPWTNNVPSSPHWEEHSSATLTSRTSISYTTSSKTSASTRLTIGHCTTTTNFGNPLLHCVRRMGHSQNQVFWRREQRRRSRHCNRLLMLSTTHRHLPAMGVNWREHRPQLHSSARQGMIWSLGSNLFQNIGHDDAVAKDLMNDAMSSESSGEAGGISKRCSSRWVGGRAKRQAKSKGHRHDRVQLVWRS